MKYPNPNYNQSHSSGGMGGGSNYGGGGGGGGSGYGGGGNAGGILYLSITVDKR